MLRERRNVRKLRKPDPKHLLQSFELDLRLLVARDVGAGVRNLKRRLLDVGELAAQNAPEREALRGRGGEFGPGGV